MAKYKKRKPEEIQAEMKNYNQKIIDLGENFKADPEKITDYFKFSANFYHYSYKNQQLIFLQNPHASFVGSYKHFKNQSFQVQKGEKGMKLFVPVTASYFNRDGVNVQLKDATKIEKEKIKQGLIDVKSELHFKLGTVFDIAQTDCPPENYPSLCDFGHESIDHAKTFDLIKNYCESNGFPVSDVSLRSIHLRGTFSPDTKDIQLNHKLQDTQKLGTFLHEMSHAFLDHKINQEHPIYESMCEFEADGLAIMFLTRFGFDITEPMKDHLSNNYKKFQSELDALNEKDQKLFSLDNSFKTINVVYKNHIEPINQILEDEQNSLSEQEPWEQGM